MLWDGAEQRVSNVAVTLRLENAVTTVKSGGIFCNNALWATCSSDSDAVKLRETPMNVTTPVIERPQSEAGPTFAASVVG